MSKQDRQGVRTPAELERKYPLSDIGKIRRENVGNNSQLEAQMKKFEKAVADKIKDLEDKMSNSTQELYPIGAVFISVNNVEPSTLFGGSWRLIKQGYLIVGTEPDIDYSEWESLGKCNIWERIEGVENDVLILDESRLDFAVLS